MRLTRTRAQRAISQLQSGLASTVTAPPELAEAADAALTQVTGRSLWLDTELAPRRRPPVTETMQVDLAIVGGGLTGLWAAELAAQRTPALSTMLIEGADLGWAASGRNGGFCSASLTHGLANGLDRWPADMPDLLRMGADNLDEIEDLIEREGLDCDFQRSGELTVAVEPWQTEELVDLHRAARQLGQDLELLDGDAVRSLLDSPTYLAGLRDPDGTAVLNPAGLLWGLAEVAERTGVSIHERTRVVGMTDDGNRVRLEVCDVDGGGTRSVWARQVLLATGAFPSPLHRVRPYVVPVWDHVLATEPLTETQRKAIGWAGQEGVSDAGNQFHYYRLTADGRIVWGGYDALYYFGGDLARRRERSPATEKLLAAHFLQTFPQLRDIRFSHAWGGTIDTSTRFTAFWQRAMNHKLVAVQGFTGLGVGASRFGAQVALDLLDHRDNARTRLAMVNSRPKPFPPEPFRWAGIQLTRRSLAGADANGGRRDLWLRSLDRLGLGFDS